MFPHERSLVNRMQGRPFVLLGVNTDRTIERVQKSVKENKLNWRSWFDARSGRITGQFEVRAFPTIMLIDHRGVIHNPKIRGEKKIDQAVEKLVRIAEGAGMLGDKVASKLHTFIDKTGKHRVKATALRTENGNVVLEKENGEVIEIATDQLSKRDQAYLQTLDVPDDSSIDSDNDPTGFRKYVDASGEFSIEAKFISLADGEVTLERRDGNKLTLQLNKLCDDDQDLVNQLHNTAKNKK